MTIIIAYMENRVTQRGGWHERMSSLCNRLIVMPMARTMPYARPLRPWRVLIRLVKVEASPGCVYTGSSVLRSPPFAARGPLGFQDRLIAVKLASQSSRQWPRDRLASLDCPPVRVFYLWSHLLVYDSPYKDSIHRSSRPFKFCDRNELPPNRLPCVPSRTTNIESIQVPL